MKRIYNAVAILLIIPILSLVLSGCGTKNSNTADTDKNISVNLAGLKGPTSIGMAKILEDNENDKAGNKYNFTLAASGDELTPKLLQGKLDIACVPINLASVLYNKSEGKIKLIAVNTLGVLYIVEKGDTGVNSVENLKGKTIYATGKGQTPEYTLRYLLKKNGLDIDSDVNVVWKTEPTEVVSNMALDNTALAMLPEPYVSVAKSKIDGLNTVLDLSKEWEKSKIGCELVTAGIVVNTDFADKNPKAVKSFLDEFESSVLYVNDNVSKASDIVGRLNIIDSNIAKKAIPNCNIVCIKGNKLKKTVDGYLKILFESNPQSVGGKIPTKDFYYSYEE